ncbi:unnamed protein product [Lactuca saligna]|uniref:Uncharacterized protein n=1 Tax=Lactuca saligna TaxID=75948 RepID=A0AA35ZGA0_LACSI|nr:unnamed protein product [Lactuca saligna]
MPEQIKTLIKFTTFSKQQNSLIQFTATRSSFYSTDLEIIEREFYRNLFNTMTKRRKTIEFGKKSTDNSIDEGMATNISAEEAQFTTIKTTSEKEQTLKRMISTDESEPTNKTTVIKKGKTLNTV